LPAESCLLVGIEMNLVSVETVYIKSGHLAIMEYIKLTNVTGTAAKYRDLASLNSCSGYHNIEAIYQIL
jgi:hypothetical protein